MAHSGSGGDAPLSPERGFRPERVASAGRRLGWALVGAALPAVTATVLVAVTNGTAAAGLTDWVASAMATSLSGGTGVKWAFHVSVVTALAGVWTLGLAFVVDGYVSTSR